MAGIGEENYAEMMKQYFASIMGQGGQGGSAIASSNPYTSAATMILGGVQAVKGFAELAKLDKKGVPKYELTDKMQDSISDADSMRGIGFTAKEMGAQQDRLARSQNTGFQRAVDASPNLVSTIQAGINYTNQAAQGSIAMNDAQLNRSNIRYSDAMREKEQNINNMNTAQDIGQFNKAQESFGIAAQTGLNNAIYGITGLTDHAWDQQQEKSGKGKGKQAVADYSSGRASSVIKDYDMPEWSRGKLERKARRYDKNGYPISLKGAKGEVPEWAKSFINRVKGYENVSASSYGIDG